MTDITRRGFLGAAGALAGASALGVPAGREKARATAITLAITEYLRYTPLLWGAIPAWTRGEGTEGIQLRFVRGTRREMLDRTLEDPSVDGGESSMLGHLLRIAQGDRSMVAVPVFPLRNFTARDLYTLRGTALDPRALDGRRLGIYNWAASGAVWYRRLLRYLGNDPASIQWVVGTADTPGLVTSRAPLPAHVRNAPAEKSLTDLVREGEIDAFFAPLPPTAYHRDNGPLARLIPDFPAFEKGYYADTGFYPPQHVLVVRRETWDRDPGIGGQLLQAFQECEIGFTEAQRLYPYESPWMMREVEDTELLMGLDYHHHGLEKNLAAMEAFLEGAFLDGLTDHRVAVEEYFREFLQG
ncbi:MAG: twin-arginine translocation signal domain-containing protein [Longimicrobiales bacterium]